MTFQNIVDEVSDRLNLTDPKARARIGRSVNERYKWLLSSVGLETSTRLTTPATATATIGNRYLIFSDVTKVITVFDATYTPARILTEVTPETLRDYVAGSEPAQSYAIARMGATTVTIIVDVVPTTAFVLSADGYTKTTTLSGNQVPSFSEDYHDILVYGAMATELKKMEKGNLARDNELTYQARISDLRGFIAKSAWLEIAQGLNKQRRWVRRF